MRIESKPKSRMFSEMRLDKFRVTAKSTVTNIVLVTNAFVWYYLVIRILDNISIKTGMGSSSTMLMWAVHFGGMAFSAIAGASLVNRISDRKRFLELWMIFGVISSAISLVLDTSYVPNVMLLSLILGSSLGLGMPSCMGYFTESIRIENRGRVGGVMLLLSGVGIAALGALAPPGNISLQTSILSAWRIFGLVFLVLFGQNIKKEEKSKTPSYRSVLSQKSFFLYLIPWIMFSLITYLAAPIQEDLMGKSTVATLYIMENAIMGVFAVIGGFLLDAVGRKRIAIVGFVLLGLGYSVLGLGDPSNVLSWYFYSVVDAIAWAMLFVIFVVTIWGDLSYSAHSDKYYAIGVLPFFISKLLQYTIGSDIARAILPTSLFSFTAFFLFIAILPLVYAPETLSEKHMRDRELKSYIEKAQRAKEKYS